MVSVDEEVDSEDFKGIWESLGLDLIQMKEG